MHVWVKPRPHTHTKHGLRFPPKYHTSYKWGYYSTPFNQGFVAGLGPKINSQACLFVLQGPCHITKCSLCTQRLIFFYILPRAPPTNFWLEPPVASLWAISFPYTPACPGTQCSPTVWQIQISFNAFWYFCTNSNCPHKCVFFSKL
jgi:hypothetical protein